MVERSNAENTIRGRGAHLLTRLDQMHFEGSFTPEEVPLRAVAYEAVSHLLPNEQDNETEDFQGEPTLYVIFEDNSAAKGILALKDDGELPMLGTAKRILRTGKGDVMLKRGDKEGQWDQFIKELKVAVDQKDEEGVRSMYETEPWVGLRKRYREAIGEGNKVSNF